MVNYKRYRSSMEARESFLEERPEFDSDDELCEAFAWIYSDPDEAGGEDEE